ncbi:ABC transporter permease subunit [Arthrobacter sp. M4]|uniref:ABC transporter permease subunit n=1 Tax=Arthrobacter sp. M4 TaxID=218160 RepID=UPI001CDC5A3D|nr:ABC transporter permease subunit [Arthrobacter sp. M4]MCA4132932.1 ABC transporter permease [Arthrobacter sp. M4]
MSSPMPLLSKSMTDSWRSTLGWAAGLCGAILLYLPLYPSIGGGTQMQQMINALPAEMTKALNYEQIATGPGYVQATVFGLYGYLLMTIATVAWGAAAVAGDEEAGQLELTLAHGVTRAQVVFERALGIALRILVLSILVFVLVMALNGPSQLQIDAGKLAGTMALFAGLALLSGTTALLVGALTGRKAYALGAGAGIAVLGYLFNALGKQSNSTEWLLNLSPYHWAYGNSPLLNGVEISAAWGLPAISACLVLAAVVALRNRDVGN